MGGAYWKYVYTLGYDTQVWWEWHACFYITIGETSIECATPIKLKVTLFSNSDQLIFPLHFSLCLKFPNLKIVSNHPYALANYAQPLPYHAMPALLVNPSYYAQYYAS